jgi:hypothetical protein
VKGLRRKPTVMAENASACPILALSVEVGPRDIRAAAIRARLEVLARRMTVL